MTPAAEAELTRFRAAIVDALGLELDESRAASALELLQKRIDATHLPSAQYLLALEQQKPPAELRELASALTIGETYFFRNPDQLRAFAAVTLASNPRRVAVLSAGCSTGEEPYSLLMLMREQAPQVELSIRAVDLNPASIERARRGRYSAWALRETSPERQARWFRKEGSDFTLLPELRAGVDFSEANLTREDPLLFRDGFYDAIFCRNVLMYFSHEQARLAVSRLARSLKPGGCFFLGHAETLRGLSNDFHLLHTHDTFYYQRKTAEELRGEALDPRKPAPGVALRNSEGSSTAWAEEVQRASERIRALAEQPRTASSEVAGKVVATPMIAAQTNSTMGTALDLLRSERYRDALELLPAAAVHDPDAQLLRAALLVHTNQLAEAEQVASSLLLENELSAGAHYLLALCDEAKGESKGAVSHDQIATYLEPKFVMPCVHLGLMSRRSGDRAQARRELTRALELLPDEDAARLLLFGGGFTRDALISLCRAELAKLEAKS